MRAPAFVAAAMFGFAAFAPSVRAAGERTPQPEIVIAQPGTHCVAPPEVMRRQHPEMLRHQRSQSLREGRRGMPASLNACIACHTPRTDAAPATATAAATATTPAASTGAAGGFCENCHAYAAVKLDCFECHAKTPRATAQQASSGVTQ